MINYKDLKKNDEVKTTQLGQPVSGKLLESPKQGRGLKKAIFIFTKGSLPDRLPGAGSLQRSRAECGMCEFL